MPYWWHLMEANDSSSTVSGKPWVLTFFGLLAAAGLIAMPFLAGPHDSSKMPDLVRFIGHFHPVLLHLPIGVFILILVQELGSIFLKRGRTGQDTSLFPLFFGAASAIVAVLAGFLLYHGGDEYAGSEVAERHLWGGLAFAVAAVVTFVWKAWTVSLSANPAFYRVLLFGSVGVMGFTSHDGASMTHGSDYLTVYAPEPIRKVLGLPVKEEDSEKPVSLDQQLVFADVVQPILEQRCVQCHKEGKSKGKFRMDTYDLLVKGGKEDAGLVPGDSAKSNIVIRMELPMEDDERMPPEGKHIEDSEIAIIKWWIDSGAGTEKTLAQVEVPELIREAIAKIAKVDKQAVAATDGGSAHGAPAAGPDDALRASVIKLSEEFPGALNFESQQSALVTFTAVSLRGAFDDAAFKKIEPLTSQLVTLDLSATKITDQAVAQLSKASNLRLIRLAETQITDQAIEVLLKLPALESINLYGTKVTDAGVAKLAGMTKLKRLYLWQTPVTPATIEDLRKKLPECEIITGTDA
jgi:uncharacterized membrane protein